MSLTGKQKKIALIVGGIVAALLLGLQLLKASIDVQSAIAPLRESVQQLAGQPLITEKLSLGVFPAPHIEVRGVAIRSPLETQQPYLMYADRLTISLGWGAFFQAQPSAQTLEFDGLKLYLEKRRDGGKSWHFLSKARQQAQQIGELTVLIRNGQILYADLLDDDQLRIDAMNGALSVDKLGIRATMNAQMMGMPLAMSADCTMARFAHLTDYDAMCSATFEGDAMQAKADYRLLKPADSGLQLRGDLEFQASDARLWGDAIFSQQEKQLQQTFSAPVPLTFKAETYSAPDKWIANVTRLALADSSGTMSIAYEGAVGSTRAALNVNTALETLDFDKFKALMDVAVAKSQKDLFLGEQLFSPNLEGPLQLKAKQLHYNGLELENIQLAGRFENGQVTVESAFGTLPHHGQFSTIGRLVSGPQGLQYEGSVEASGKALWAQAPLIGLQATTAAKQHLTAFRTRFNCSIAPRSSIVSELRLLVGENIRIAGGVNWQHHANQNSEVTGSLSFENADFRPFYEEWLGGMSLYNPVPESPQEPFAFHWLKQTPLNANLSLQLNSVLLPFDANTNGRFQLVLVPRKMTLEAINLQLDKVRVGGEMSLSTPQDAARPMLDAKLILSELALGNWLRSSMWRAADERLDAGAPSVWSKKPFNFNPLRHFDASIDVSANHVQHEAFTADSFQFLARLKGGLLTMDRWAMQLWDGNFSASGALDLRTLPTLDLSYRHDNADVLALMQAFYKQEALSGKVSLAHTLKSSGVNFDEWIRNLTGGLRFEVSNLTARNFNLARLIQLTGSARTVSELPNILRQAEAGGATRIERVQGVLHYGDAKLQTTQISLGARGISGQMLVLADLLKWHIDSTIQLQFDQLKSAAGSPQLRIRYAGALDEAERTLNLKSIEAYLTQKQR